MENSEKEIENSGKNCFWNISFFISNGKPYFWAIYSDFFPPSNSVRNKQTNNSLDIFFDKF